MAVARAVVTRKIIVGHQGYLDDRENVKATAYHRKLAELGVFVQFDRIGYDNYPVDNRTEFIGPRDLRRGGPIAVAGRVEQARGEGKAPSVR